MKYLFVLGRNPKLSIAEIFSVFESRNIQAKILDFAENGLVIEAEKEISAKEITGILGGTIAAGKIVFSGSFESLKEFLKNNEIYFEKEIKFNYSVLHFSGKNEKKLDEILSLIKDRFKEGGLKARYKSIKGKVEMQSGEIYFGSPSKIKSSNMPYFMFEGKEIFFGLIEAVSNTKEAEKRDMEKPVRRESLAISPRLAKILVNLSQARKNEALLDPFCGIGAVLQEAMIRGINAVGIDIDKSAIIGAEKNLQWLAKMNKLASEYTLINADSSNVRLGRIDGVATEPFLSELFKSRPSESSALASVRRFEEMMIRVLNNIKNSLKFSAKIAFTSPLIKTQGKNVSCDISMIMRETGLKLHSFAEKSISFPISEIRSDSIVGREFYVLEA